MPVLALDLRNGCAHQAAGETGQPNVRAAPEMREGFRYDGTVLDEGNAFPVCRSVKTLIAAQFERLT